MPKRDPRQFANPPSVRRRDAHPFDEPDDRPSAEVGTPGKPDTSHPSGASGISAKPDTSYATEEIVRPVGTALSGVAAISPTPRQPPRRKPQARPGPDSRPGPEVRSADGPPSSAKALRVTRGTQEVVRRQTFWLAEEDIAALEELQRRVRVPGVSGVPDKSAVVREALRRLRAAEGI